MAARHRRDPVRTCVGCRRPAMKGGLIRIVRTAEGRLQVDHGATAPGRGAYVHADAECVSAAFGRGGLARALRTSLGHEEASTLRADIEGVMHR